MGEDEHVITIPADSDLRIITKAFVEDYHLAHFTPFEVPIAVGGVARVNRGIVKPRHCYATLYYSKDLGFEDIDFHEDWR